MKDKKRIVILLLATTFMAAAWAQRSDSLIMQQLRDEGVTFSHDNSVVLLRTGQEKFDDMFAAIRQAKSSIHLEYFNFRNDSNNRPLKKHHLDSIRAHGVQIYEYDPIRFPWVNHVFTRDHRKIVVIDGKIAYTGGMNVADYYINGTEVVGEWRDMHCRIEGEEVNTLQRIFLKIWNKVSKEHVNDAKYFRLTPDAGDYFHDLKPDTTSTAYHQTVGIINREPRISNKIIRKFYVNAIRDARDSIKLINPYLTLNYSLKKALRDAVKRGVKVEVMVSAKSDIPLTPDCVFYNVHRLMKHGVDVWIYKPGFHHTKVIMVDGRFCTVGSANLNSRSLRFDLEENAVIIDPNVTQQLSDMFDHDKADSFYLTPETWNQFRTRWQKTVGWFAHLLSAWL
jgi:cardiolipin synthase